MSSLSLHPQGDMWSRVKSIRNRWLGVGGGFPELIRVGLNRATHGVTVFVCV